MSLMRCQSERLGSVASCETDGHVAEPGNRWIGESGKRDSMRGSRPARSCASTPLRHPDRPHTHSDASPEEPLGAEQRVSITYVQAAPRARGAVPAPAGAVPTGPAVTVAARGSSSREAFTTSTARPPGRARRTRRRQRTASATTLRPPEAQRHRIIPRAYRAAEHDAHRPSSPPAVPTHGVAGAHDAPRRASPRAGPAAPRSASRIYSPTPRRTRPPAAPPRKRHRQSPRTPRRPRRRRGVSEPATAARRSNCRRGPR